MIGRAAIGYPWVFNEIKHFMKTGEHLAPPTIADRVDAVKEHLAKSLEWKGPVEGIFEMRPHYANYFRGISHFKEWRMKLVTLNLGTEVFEVLEEIKDHYLNVEV
jgi:tRNA-dihydrouridine synthase B